MAAGEIVAAAEGDGVGEVTGETVGVWLNAFQASRSEPTQIRDNVFILVCFRMGCRRKAVWIQEFKGANDRGVGARQRG